MNRCDVLGKIALIGVLAFSQVACDSGKDSPEDRCEQNEALVNEVCVQTCESDENCTQAICHEGFCENVTRPVLADFSPVDQGVDVSVHTTIQLVFSEPMAQPGAGDLVLLEGEQEISLTVLANETSQEFTLTPETLLKQGSLYSVRISETFQSALSIPLRQSTEFTFSTVEALAVTNITPANGDTGVALLPRLNISFSRPVGELSSNGIVLTAVNGGPEIDIDISATSDLSQWVVVPQQALGPALDYLLTVGTEAVAVDGGVLEEPVLSWFTTGQFEDTTPPEIVFTALPAIIGPNHLSEAGQIVFQGSVTDLDGLVAWVSARLSVGGDQWELGVLETFEADAFEFSWDPEQATDALDGAAELSLVAVDSAGNVADFSSDVTLDFVAPNPPAPLAQVPGSWKFKTLDITWTTEVLGSVVLRVGAAPEEILVANELGEVSKSLELSLEGESTSLEAVAIDSVGNVSTTNWQHSVTRVPYSCLHVNAGFPTADAFIDTSAFVDDEEGQVRVRYRLDPDMAEDTVLHGQLVTQNFSTTPYLSLRFFPRVLGLLKFSDLLLHPCAELESATLGFYSRPVCSNCEMSETIGFYGVAVPWTSTEANWAQASMTASWDEPGMSTLDRDALATAMLVYETLDDADVGTVDLTPLVESWVAYLNDPLTGRPNHGVAFFQDDALSTDFHSVDASDPAQVPYLELVWVEQP